MALFPQTFLDDLHLHADIVQVIGDVVSLKRSGATWKGLCPFHGEKTPSFHVNREKGFFHCFGCHVGGDVIKFMELHEKVSFPEAVRMLAGRFGLTVPEAPETESSGTTAAEREALLKVHEVAAAWFRAQLESAAGARVRQQLAARNISAQTIADLGIGFAPPAREALKAHLIELGFAMPLLLRSGLVVQRDTGEIVDRFRNRLMIPICRDAGSVIAFGGRATEADQQPKYLNSPETPIYSKSRTLYGLNYSKAAIRKLNFAVLVEGYFDVAQLLQAGISPVVASCGTALTPQQAQLLRRFTSKVVLSFDPDAAGQGEEAGNLLLHARRRHLGAVVHRLVGVADPGEHVCDWVGQHVFSPTYTGPSLHSPEVFPKERRGKASGRARSDTVAPPRALRHPGNGTLVSQLAQADPAKLELLVDGPRATASVAPRVRLRLVFRRPLLLDAEGGLGHALLVPSALGGERQTEVAQERPAWIVRLSRCRDGDVETPDRRNAVVVDLGEDHLLLHAERVVAATVEGLRAKLAEVADPRESDRYEPVEELVHLRAPQGHSRAHGHPLTKLEARDRLSCATDLGVLAGNGGELLIAASIAWACLSPRPHPCSA